MREAVLLHRPDGGCAVIAPYDPAFVAVLKERIPWRGRKWDPDNKRWLVAAGWTRDARAVASAHYDRVVDAEERPLRAPPPPPSTGGIDPELYVPAHAPESVVRAVYRVLAMENHPDRGGDGEKMRRINAAYERMASRWR